MTERRVSFKVEELGLGDVVSRLLAEGFTYTQISEELANQGHEVGRSSIARYNRSAQRKLETIRKTREVAEAMAEVLKSRPGDGPDTDMVDMLLAAFSQNLLAASADDEMSNKELGHLSMAAARIASSKSQIEKLKEDLKRQYARAWKRATDELRKILKDSGLWPDVEAALTKHSPVREQ